MTTAGNKFHKDRIRKAKRGAMQLNNHCGNVLPKWAFWALKRSRLLSKLTVRIDMKDTGYYAIYTVFFLGINYGSVKIFNP